VVKEVRAPAQTTLGGTQPVFTTLFAYDTWNRIQSLTYSDGEALSFNYDSGGNIKAITGQKQVGPFICERLFVGNVLVSFRVFWVLGPRISSEPLPPSP